MGKRLEFKAIAKGAMRSWSFWFLALVFVGVCTYQFENWRGHRAWKHYVQAAKAKRLHLDWPECIPPQVPDSENFAMTPVLAQIYGLASSTAGVPTLDLKRVLDTVNTNRVEPKVGDWIHGIPASLLSVLTNKISPGGLNGMSEAMRRRYGFMAPVNGPSQSMPTWQSNDLVIVTKYAAMEPRGQAEKILSTLAPLEPVWAELREAMKRPYCRYPYPYNQTINNNPTPPHLDRIRDLGQWLRLWAICQLELGNHEAALEAIELVLYLGDSVQAEPWVAAYATRYALGEAMNQVIWEGTRRNLWTDPELAQIQRLRPLTNYVAEAPQVIPRLRAVEIRRLEAAWANAAPFVWNEFKDNSWHRMRDYFCYFAYKNWGPDGWLELEKISLCRRDYDEYSGKIFEAHSGRIQLAAVASYNASFEEPGTLQMYFRHEVFVPHGIHLNMLAQQIARRQTGADFAYLGCALERYWLAKGAYPERLETLVPEYAAKVPHDVLTGEPYHYHRDDKDHFLLYSVGFDGKDDGGTVRTNKSSRIVEGDWLWCGGTRTTP